jgi:hypothetical protein
MRVEELIEKLKLLPQDALVVAEGYETGYEPVKNVELISVIENPSRDWWDGEYEKSEGSDTLEVVFLNSGQRISINKQTENL